MDTREHFLSRLLELPRVDDLEVRRGVFRQTIVSLGSGESTGAPMALAGVDPRALGRSIQVVCADGMLDRLDFIEPRTAAVALYQIAGALPLGDERRVIGRHVLNHLYQGDAGTFAALAWCMAMGSSRPLTKAAVRARVALSMSLHGHAEAEIDRLALAIVSRRELAQSWIVTAATGSLPERRMAAQLLERAARCATRRAIAGDSHPLRVFQAIASAASGDPAVARSGFAEVAMAWDALLSDRETLVWRHVAVARGLLCQVMPAFVDETRSMLTPEQTVTEWRRGATSLVARLASDCDRGLAEAIALVDSGLLKRDPGIAVAMVWGLSVAAEAEPEAAAELLDVLASAAPLSIAESLSELRLELPDFGARARASCAAALRSSMARPELDDGLSALARLVRDELDGRPSSTLAAQVNAALAAFGEKGPRAAHALARQALALATEHVVRLETLVVGHDQRAASADARRDAMQLLFELDRAMLESPTLGHLLVLDRPPGADVTGIGAVDELETRIGRWLLDPQRLAGTPEQLAAQTTLHQRQLRTLLHVIDSGTTDQADDQARRGHVRHRFTLAIRSFAAYLRGRPSTRLTRAIIASVARAFDALVRDGAAEVVDVFLFVAITFVDAAHIAIVAEASMQPDVTQLLTAYLEFVRFEAPGTGAEALRARVEACKRFLERFPSQTTLRAEAFRTTAWRLLRALSAVISAHDLKALLPAAADGAGSPLDAIDDSITQLGELVVGAERRAAEIETQSRVLTPRRRALAHAVEAAVRGKDAGELLDAVTATVRGADVALPVALAQLVTQIMPRLASLQAARGSLPPRHTRMRDVELPNWLPSRRIIGGFYVVHALGGGNVGSVFVVTRAEDRHDKDAQRFALKVPEYDVTAARTMSEAEFLKLFREEAGALLAIPEHKNVASFVTFDAGAKPKPILVMELVEGMNCERLLASNDVTMPLALRVIDGVMAGLEAMHAAGIAHLDVKPSNTILRDRTEEPVLVDFGLAGRVLRPGCATLCYGAPEIWETAAGSAQELPARAADAYALGCLAYEMLTGLTLFDGQSDVAVISAHITHDGSPPPVAQLAQSREHAPLAQWLTRCLRAAPRDRSSMTTLRAELARVRPDLERMTWPLRLA